MAANLAIDPIRKLGTVVDDQVRLMPYGDALQPAGDLPRAGARACATASPRP